MLSLKIVAIGAVISYGIAILMKVTMLLITAFSKTPDAKEGR